MNTIIAYARKHFTVMRRNYLSTFAGLFLIALCLPLALREMLGMTSEVGGEVMMCLGWASVLILTSLGMLTLPFVLFSDQSLIEFLITNRNQYILLTICSAGLMLVALSYMLQDIRYIITVCEHKVQILKEVSICCHQIISKLCAIESIWHIT